MIVLGISAYFHDSAAALVIDGEIVAAAQEERFSRVKHDARLPMDAIRFCLEQAGITLDEVDQVVFYEKPLRKFERILVTQLREFPRGAGQFARALGTWLTKRLWLKSELCAELGCAPEQLLFVDHHLSHAASSFLCAPFEHAAVVTADGVGEWASTTIYDAHSSKDSTRIDPVEEIRFPDSIGLLYSALTAYLGFRVNEGEYKVMGLASYGEPRFAAQFEKLCMLKDDGSFRLDPTYFAYQRSAEHSFTPAMVDLLGPARTADAPLRFEQGTVGMGGAEDQRFADIAASLQHVTEQAMLGLARRAKERTGASALCLAGGVALNSVANRKIAESGIFEHVFVQPAAGDAGGALGAALYVDHVLGGTPRRGGMGAPFYGQAFADQDVRSFLADCRVKHTHHADDAGLLGDVASRLAGGEVGAWFQGRFEWGPRALGARSILADPRDPSMADRVNRKIKFREPFRPFAPAVRAEEAGRWFDTGNDEHLTRFMLSVAPVTAEGRKTLPATTHVDGTARVQTVHADENPRFHGLLDAFRAETGVGVLLNTSLNLKGEPLCASPAEAYGVFRRSALDFLAIENCVISKADIRRRGEAERSERLGAVPPRSERRR